MRCETTFTRDTARRPAYSYYVGTDDEAHSPFRRRTSGVRAAARTAPRSTRCGRPLVGRALLSRLRRPGHRAGRRRSPLHASRRAEWRTRPGGLVFEIEANRFLHHMVRFLVGTMIDIARGRRPAADVDTLLARERQRRTCRRPRRRTRSFSTRVCYPARTLSLRSMKIYLATASTDDVAWGAAHGMLDGVITSPGLLADDADAEMRDASRRAVPPRRTVPIFASVHSVDAANAYRDGKELAKISDQIVVQLPLVEETLGAMRRLQADGVRVVGDARSSTRRRRCSPRGPARPASSRAVDRLDAAGHDGVTTIARACAPRSTRRMRSATSIALHRVVARAVRRMRRRRRRCRRPSPRTSAAPCSFIRSPIAASTSSSATSRVFVAHGLRDPSRALLLLASALLRRLLQDARELGRPGHPRRARRSASIRPRVAAHRDHRGRRARRAGGRHRADRGRPARRGGSVRHVLRRSAGTQTQAGLGTGFIVRADGVIVTNAHVVAGATRSPSCCATARSIPPRSLGTDETNDIAVAQDRREGSARRAARQLEQPRRRRVGDRDRQSVRLHARQLRAERDASA